MEENPRMRRIRDQKPTLDRESDRLVSDSNRARQARRPLPHFIALCGYRTLAEFPVGDLSRQLTRTTPAPDRQARARNQAAEASLACQADDLKVG
jgi:hypothetical protein